MASDRWYDEQFRETTEERNERLRDRRLRLSIGALQGLVTDLSDNLCDEGADYSADGLEAMRRRVANALPPQKCPEWLNRYRDPPVTTGAV